MAESYVTGNSTWYPPNGGTYNGPITFTTGTTTFGGISSWDQTCVSHVLKDITCDGPVASGYCQNCGVKIMLSSLDFTPFLQRMKALMSQAIMVLDTPDDALEVLVALGAEISADLQTAEEIVDEMRSLRELCLAFVTRLSSTAN